MTFLILGMQKQVEQRNLSRMQLELVSASDKQEYYADLVKDLQDCGVSNDDADLKYLQACDEQYSDIKESLESQIKLLEGDIKSLEEGEKNGIKNSAPSFG